MTKRRKIAVIAIIIAAIAVVAGIIAALALMEDDESVLTDGNVTITDNGASAETITVDYTSRDLDDSSDGSAIKFSGDSVTSDDGTVDISGTTVTIKKEGSYVLSGNTTDGKVVISAGETADVHLILNGITLKCSDGPAVYETDGAKVVITIADNTENTLEDGSGYVTDTTSSNNDEGESSDAETEDEAQPSACIYGTGSLTFNGGGSLTVIGNSANGIKSKDNLKVIDCSISVECVKNALVGNDSVAVRDATIDAKAGNDGVKARTTDDETKGYIVVESGVINIEASDDGFQAITTAQFNGGKCTIKCEDKGITCDGNVVLDGGNITVAESDEGIQGKYVIINSGSLDIVSNDDGINASTGSGSTFMMGKGRDFNGGENSEDSSTDNACSITINGGKISIDASGDGIDSNGDIFINGGEIYIDGPTSGDDGALDCGDRNNSIKVTGGTLLAVGGSGMAEFPSSESTQYVLCMTPQSQSEGTVISVEDADGNEVFSYTSKKSFSSICFSSPELKKDSSYTVYLNDTAYTSMTVSDILNTDGNTIAGGFGKGGKDGGIQDGKGIPDREITDGRQMPDGEKPDGEMPDGEKPDGEMPDGEKPDGKMRGGKMRGGEDFDDTNLPDQSDVDTF